MGQGEIQLPVLLDSRRALGLPVTSVLRALEYVLAVTPMRVPKRETSLTWVLKWVDWQPQTLLEPGGTLSIPPWAVSSEIRPQIYQRWSQFEAWTTAGRVMGLRGPAGEVSGAAFMFLVHLGLSKAGVHPPGALGTDRDLRPASTLPCLTLAQEAPSGGLSRQLALGATLLLKLATCP